MKCKSCGAEFNEKFCPYCGAASQDEKTVVEETPTQDTNFEKQVITPAKIKKPIYKKWWFWIIAVLLFLGLIGSFGDSSSNNDATELNWSNMTLGSLIPSPESNLGKKLINTEDYLSVDVLDISPDVYKEYVNGCKEKGFVIEVDEYDTYFDAQNEDGYKLSLYYIESENVLTIDLTVPDKDVSINNEQPGDNTETKEKESIINNETALVTNKIYLNLEEFVAKYNSYAKTPISNTEIIDIQSPDYYRTEFRLNAFQNAPAYKGAIGSSSIEIINSNYDGIFGSDLRIYAYTGSVETVTDIFESFCKACDSDISQSDFDEFYEYNQLDSGDCRIVINQISGYIMKKDGGFEILLDATPEYFNN